MFNRRSSHYSGTGIVSARKNKYGKIWYGTNHLESMPEFTVYTSKKYGYKQLKLTRKRKKKPLI